MVQQSPIDEQIRDYILQQERIEARCQPAPISFRQERRKWERRLGYFILGGVAVLVFALNEHLHNKSGQVIRTVSEVGLSHSLAHLSTFTVSFG